MTSTPSPPGGVAADDHAFAAWAATVAGELLTDVRGQGLEGRALKDAGDKAAHDLLMAICAEHRPDDAVMSEESQASINDAGRLSADRVWIIDPLDGTREFSEPPRDDWAVHVALWARGAGDGSSRASWWQARSHSPAWGGPSTPGAHPPFPSARRIGPASR